MPNPHIRTVLMACALAAFLFRVTPAHADDAPPTASDLVPIGMNLAGTGSIATQWDFVDLMKGSNPWVYNLGAKDGQLTPIDDMGNPVLGVGEGARTLLRLKITNSSQNRIPDYPLGEYTIKWEGKGTFVLFGSGDTEYVYADGAGTQTFNARFEGQTLQLNIAEVDQADPLRNIQVIMPGYGPGEANDGQQFHQEFLDRTTGPFGTLRFMDWSRANKNKTAQWDDRVRDGANQYSLDGGVPVEEMVRLSNLNMADPWFTMPTHADDNYVRQFAEYVRDNLEPNKKVFVEYGNEVWNGGFEGYHYVRAQAAAAGRPANGLDENFATQWAIEARRDFDIWLDVFAGQEDRIQRVAAIQGANRFISPIFIDQMTVGGVPQFEVLSPAFYFSPNTGSYDGSTTADDIIDDLAASLDQHVDPTIEQFLPGTRFEVIGPAGDWLLWRQFADDLGVDLIAYEGGQHITTNGNFNVPWYQAYLAAQRSPRMYDVYTEFLENVFDVVGADGLVNFSSVGLISQWGAWGVKEYQDQPIDEAPKYKALIDFINARYPLPTLVGDANGDGQVDGNDLIDVEENFGATGEPGIPGDANGDGQVDGNDLISVEENFGGTTAAGAIPEPASVALLLGIGAVAAIRRQHR